MKPMCDDSELPVIKPVPLLSKGSPFTKNKKLATNGGSDNKHISSSTKPKGSNILDKKRNVMGKYGGINVERKIGPKKRK